MSLKNPMTPPGIDPGTVRLVVQRLNHYTTPGPLMCNLGFYNYRGADKSLARPTCRGFFNGENISFDANLVIYINSTNVPPIMIINRIYENENLLLL
jgi:hypothetical protein